MCWWRRREHILPQKVKERGVDLKGEGRGSHVMHSSSTAEPLTNANPQSALCYNCASPLDTATGFPSKMASKTGEVSPIFPETPLTLPSLLLPKLYGPTDPFYTSIWTTKLNSATILNNKWRNYCATGWESKILSAQLRNSDLVVALWFNALLCATLFFMILPASHYFLEKSASSQPRYAPVGKAILNRKQVFCWEKSSMALFIWIKC